MSQQFAWISRCLCKMIRNVKLCPFCVSGWMWVLVGVLILLFHTTLTFCPHLSASSPNLCYRHLSGCGLSSQTGITCVRCQVHLCIQVWRASINPCLKCHWPCLVSCGRWAPSVDSYLMHSLLRPVTLYLDFMCRVVKMLNLLWKENDFL